MASAFGPELPPELKQDEKKEEPKPKEDPGPALMWDESTEIDPDNPDYAAMMALKEDLTPDEQAEALKEQGNECLKRKRPFYFREAVKCYTQAIEVRSGHAEHNSIYYGNRAHAQLQLGNYAKAMSDAKAAIDLNPANVKAYYRAAKAAIALKRFDEALACSQEGLKRDPENAEMQGFVKTATEEIAAQKLQELRIREAQEGADKLLAVLNSKGLRFGRAHFGAQTSPPWVDEQGRLHFRVLLLYPESMQVDTIEDVCESDVLGLHLDEMFGPAAPPLEWDHERAYKRDKIQLVAEAREGPGAGVGYPGWTQAKTRAWLLEGTPGAVKDAAPEEPEEKRDDVKRVAVPETKTLLQALKQNRYVVPGMPIFLVVPRGSAIEKLVLSGKWNAPR